MCMINIIQQYIQDLLQILKQYTPLMNSHMVDYFTKNAYENCVPFPIRKEIESFGYDTIIDCIFSNNFTEDTPHLNNFIKITKDFSLCNRKDVCLNVAELQKKFMNSGYYCNEAGLQLKFFMKPKKSHEVEVLSTIVASLRAVENVTHLVDIGDGKGYLSSLLSLHYKIPVLGIDASIINTTGAIKRAEKLGKFWPGIINTNKSMLPQSERKSSTMNALYKQVTQFVTEDTNFKELIRNVFMDDVRGIGVVGLHTCGNLAPVIAKVYVNNEDIRTLCNVSCCYHLLSEKESDVNEKSCGFPMSKFLLNKNYYLGRTARMLSAQSIDRILTKKELPNKNIFYRAVFEVFLNEYYPDHNSRNVGKFKSPVPFTIYTKNALEKLNIISDIDEDKISNFYSDFMYREKEIYIFNLLRCMLAPLIESLILLDRLLYLHECNIRNSYVVQLFNPVISPRCYGIISYKNFI